ncbi:MAG: TIGR04053 family radical SAM/SPASM domain-containing protein [Brockia lithotrophica]|nr:TIGR04053 family radical SAM/SPASM domain-containing protein [Brockia lithotrophica]
MRHFDDHPVLVIWEVTRACLLKCRHCRARAQYRRDPRELSTEEGKKLIRDIYDMGTRLLVFSGGDALMREDLFELVSYARKTGLEVALSPSATPLVTEAVMEHAAELGLHRWSFSLDGSTREIHDAFRGFRGTYEKTVWAIGVLRRLGMPLQVNTVVSSFNLHDLPNIARLLETWGVEKWEVFFLIPTGRARQEDMVSPEEFEAVLEWLVDLERRVPFEIKTTEAPQIRRVRLERLLREMGREIPPGGVFVPEDDPELVARLGKAMRRYTRGVNDGDGFLFVSHIGDLYPSGFLPYRLGNARETPIAEVYRNHPLLRALRDPDRLEGKCRACEFRYVCGGSRARAFALTGNPLAADPSCSYVPPLWRAESRDPSREAAQPFSSQDRDAQDAPQAPKETS